MPIEEKPPVDSTNNTSSRPLSSAATHFMTMAISSDSDSYFNEIRKNKELLKGLDSEEIKTKAATYNVFERFGRKSNVDELLWRMEEDPHERLGEIGMLSPDALGNFHYGPALSPLEAGMRGAFLGGAFFSLGSTNQGFINSGTQIHNNMSLLEGSTAANEGSYEKPAFTLREGLLYNDQGQLVTPRNSGISLDSNWFNDRELDEPLLPNKVVGIDKEGNNILAISVLPKKRVSHEGLSNTLALSPEEDQFHRFNKDTGATWGNWGRFARLHPHAFDTGWLMADLYANSNSSGMYNMGGPLLRFVGLDTSVLPLVDLVDGVYQSDMKHPALLGKAYGKDINGAAEVEAIEFRDPDLYRVLTSHGVDWELLKQTDNASIFRAHIYGTVLQQSLIRSTAVSLQNDNWIKRTTYSGMSMIHGTITDGDAVGQVVLTALTIGANLGVSAAATGGKGALTFNSGIKTGTALSRIGQAGTALRGTSATVEATAKIMNTAFRWMPVNLPGSTIEVLAKRYKSLRWLGEAQKSGGFFKRAGLWVAGQSVEGFVEEGFTDQVNQNFEYAVGLRTQYSLGQTWDQAVAGAIMEPVLGGLLFPGTALVGITGSYATNLSALSIGKTFGISTARMGEFNHYMSIMGGSYNEMSDIDKRAREQSVLRALITENSLKNNTVGAYTKAESSYGMFANIGQRIKSLTGRQSNVNLISAAAHVGDLIDNLNNGIGPLNANQQKALDANIANGSIVVSESGRYLLSEKATTLILTQVAVGASGSRSQGALNNLVQQDAKDKFVAEVKEKNADLVTAITEAQNEKNPELRKTKIEEATNKLSSKIHEVYVSEEGQARMTEILREELTRSSSLADLFGSQDSLVVLEDQLDVTQKAIAASNLAMEGDVKENLIKALEEAQISAMKKQQSREAQVAANKDTEAQFAESSAAAGGTTPAPTPQPTVAVEAIVEGSFESILMTQFGFTEKAARNIKLILANAGVSPDAYLRDISGLPLHHQLDLLNAIIDATQCRL